MREETRKHLCELIWTGEDEALRQLVASAAEKRHTDFWTIIENMTHLISLEEKLDCSS